MPDSDPSPPVRIDRDILDEIEALRPAVQKRLPAVKVTRAIVLRMVLHRGIAAVRSEGRPDPRDAVVDVARRIANADSSREAERMLVDLAETVDAL